MQLPLAVVEPTGQPGDAVAVHDAVGDQAHGPADEISSAVPLGRTWCGVGTAAFAGPEASQLGGRCGWVEADIVRLRSHGRAAGPAVDPGGHDGGEEPAVKAGILALHSAVALLVGDHPTMVAARAEEDQRLSDIATNRRVQRHCGFPRRGGFAKADVVFSPGGANARRVAESRVARPLAVRRPGRS